ncbi:Uncharacterized protein YR821_2702 [Yersinia ruckeri]|uniref:Uncharacterized protein n=1 Tax=Yersinia ruckeri TaxID=29486 RepID=A0A0A8VFH5_YERRU|nr:hypothetical protein yruck0001_6030 [Yersinia ruckeri ATCC 29473]QTD77619.1 Uncharacterized protein YR821_2702 [Yersinia ruckeri]CEK28542.1 hypothetical protein CSF007_14050 [Yersinia ruckeri]
MVLAWAKRGSNHDVVSFMLSIMMINAVIAKKVYSINTIVAGF